MVAQELQALLVRLDLLVRQVAMEAREALGLLGLQARLVLLDPQVQEEVREALGLLGLLEQLDPLVPLVPQELQAQVEDQQARQALQAPLELLLLLEQTAKFNTTMVALQWVEPQDFTITTLQIE